MAGLFRATRRLFAPKPLEPARLVAGGRDIELVFRRNARAKRLVLRLNSEGNAAVLTVPKGVSRQKALDFAERSADWLAARLTRQVAPTPMAPGQSLPLRGELHEIRHLPVRRGTVRLDREARAIEVTGDLPHVARRLTDWLKGQAKDDLLRASLAYAEAMGVSFRNLSVRDQKSRWGSCSATGQLSYSWRLVLAPPYVLDYVAAHEVAHLRHMNHGPQYWRLVLRHCPHAAASRKWLKANGQSLHRIRPRTSVV